MNRHKTRPPTEPEPPVTTTLAKPTPDGQLQPARTQLDDAITALINPQPHTLNNQIIYTPSLYKQLTQAIPGTFLGRAGAPQSRPPIWIDAADLLTEIDTTTRRWQPDTTAWFTGLVFVVVPIHYSTPQRLHLLNGNRWRPQDTTLITNYARQLETWTKRIETLFAETHTKHLPAPCPACNQKTVYRRDSAGETVRQPALQIGVHGCQCQNCHHVWGPSLFMHLARVLGYQLPAGVLE